MKNAPMTDLIYIFVEYNIGICNTFGEYKILETSN